MARDLDELLVEAFQARQNELPELAQSLFTEAMEQLPGDAALRIEIARCLVDRSLRSEARKCLRDIGPIDGDPELQLELARIWRLAGDTTGALSCYRQITGDNEFHRQAILEAALIHERLGHMDEARAGLPEEHHSAEVTLARGVIAEREKDPVSAAAYRQVRTSAGSSPLGTEAGYRLARLTLAAGDSGGAFSLLEKVKAEEARSFPAGREALIRKQRASEIALLDRFANERWPEAPDDAAPIWMVTGHARSGTTLLARLLEARGLHWIDEAPAFGALAREMSPRWQAGASGDLPRILAEMKPSERTEFASAYRTRLADWGGAPPAGPLLDKNPGLWTMLPSVMTLLPGWRGIVLLRDPRDVALSCYFQRFGGTSLGISCNTLEGAVDAVAHAYEHWLRFRPMIREGRCLELRYEDLAADPLGMLDAPQVQAWLSTAANFDGPADSGSPRLLENPSYAQVEEPPHLKAVRRWEKLEGPALVTLRKLDPVAKKTGYE